MRRTEGMLLHNDHGKGDPLLLHNCSVNSHGRSRLPVAGQRALLDCESTEPARALVFGLYFELSSTRDARSSIRAPVWLAEARCERALAARLFATEEELVPARIRAACEASPVDVRFEFIGMIKGGAGKSGNHATVGTFRLSKQIIIPFGIRMAAKVGCLASFPHNANVHFFAGRAVDGIKRLCLRIDPFDGLFARHTPLPGGVSDVGDVLVLAVPIRLINAGDFVLFHFLEGDVVWRRKASPLADVFRIFPGLPQHIFNPLG